MRSALSTWLAAAVLAASIAGLGGRPAQGELPPLDPLRAQQRPGPIERGSDAEARDLIGRRPPDLPVLVWLDGRSRSLADLAGRVVVIRSFTHTCPFCAATLPALGRIHEEYGPRGVVVLGVYHPKPPRPVAPDEVARHLKAFGIHFPVTIDPDWTLVDRWWLDGGRSWTSVTWVLDRTGVIRHVHPGGEYHPGGGGDHQRCRYDESALRRMLDQLTRDQPTRRVAPGSPSSPAP